MKSGRIVNEEEKSATHDKNLDTIFDCLKKSDPIDGAIQKMLKDLKTLIRLLFYHISLTQGRNEVRELLKSNDMLMHNYGENLCDPVSFWNLMGSRIRRRVQASVPHQEMGRLIPHLLEQEYHLNPKDPSYDEVFFPLMEYVVWLYAKSNPYKYMIELMNEEKEINYRYPFRARDNKLYLNELAKLLTCVNFNYASNQSWLTDTPCQCWSECVPWRAALQTAKGRLCFDPQIDHGCTVIQRRPTSMLTLTNFMSLDYEIIESGEKFTSPETDARKALLLHKRCTQKPPLCRLESHCSSL